MLLRRAVARTLGAVLWCFVSAGDVWTEEPPATPAQVQPPAQPQQPLPETAKPDEIEQPQPTFYVHAAPDRESRQYYQGEQMAIRVKSEADAYLYVIYEQADGESYVVFPNSAQPDNRVRAQQEVELPGKEDTFRWTVGAPFGDELMKVIASKERVAGLETPEVRQKRFTPVSGKELRSVARHLTDRAPPGTWSEVTLKITTHAGLNPNSRYFGKRYAVLFGVPEQWVTQPTEAVFEKAPASNLALGPLFDVTMMQRCLVARGEMDGVVLVAGDKLSIDGKPTPPATKENMKRIITEELPGMTQPGDTLLIYFTGHGSQFRDATEKDGLCEFLVPCDVMDALGLIALRKLDQANAKEGKALPDHLKELLAKAEGWLRDEHITFEPGGEAWQSLNASSRDELLQKANDVLIKKSGISDDEFGHWLQALDGRRVVVVLDACMSGGFAEEEGDKPSAGTKGAAALESLGIARAPSAPAFRFDFLSGQLSRLKDLGQGNTAMLAAARSSEPSQQSILFPENVPAYSWRSKLVKDLTERERPGKGDFMGVFTFYLVNTLLESTGPVDVKQAGETCQHQLEEYFRWKAAKSDVPSKPGHAPVFFDHSRPAILLKP